MDTFLEFLFGAFLIIVALGLIGGLLYAAGKAGEDWDKFKVAHHCKVVAQISGSSTTAIGFTAKGSMTVTPVFIPGKTGYACDDGVTYYR